MDLNTAAEFITEKDCYRILEQHTGENDFHILKYEINKAGSKIMGYMGDHFRLRIQYQLNPGSKIHNEIFFMKTKPLSNKTQAKYVEDLGLFKKESLLYKNILNKLTAISGSFFCPKCYLVKNNCLVFEDLSQRKFKVKETYLNLEESKHLVECLAVFHSSTMVYEELNSKDGKEFRMDQVFKEEIRETAFSFIEGQPRNMWLNNNTKCISDCIKLVPGIKDADELIEKLRKVALIDMETYIGASTKYRNTITHCDLWGNNFMINEDLKCVLVDFQLVRYSPPAYDLLLTLFLNIQTSLLEKHLEKLLDIYYNTFEKMLIQYKLPAQLIFPKTLFMESVQYYKLPTLLEAVFFTTNTLISPEMSNYLLQDAERYYEFAFTNRSKYIMEEYKKNDVFRKGFLDLLMPLLKLLRGEN